MASQSFRERAQRVFFRSKCASNAKSSTFRASTQSERTKRVHKASVTLRSPALPHPLPANQDASISTLAILPRLPRLTRSGGSAENAAMVSLWASLSILGRRGVARVGAPEAEHRAWP
eukprot:365061-Chlamydomonas_euryale.AAC.8